MSGAESVLARQAADDLAAWGGYPTRMDYYDAVAARGLAALPKG